MLTVVTFKWEPLKGQLESIPTQKGASKVDYGFEHVLRHYNMVKRNLHIPFNYVLITDKKEPELPEDICQIDLWNTHRQLGGCYHRLFTFAPEFEEYVGERFIQMDLDMIITGDITPLLDREEDFVYYRMKGPDGTGWRMNNGMYMMNTGARSFVWETFNEHPRKAMSKRVGNGTDQGITNSLLDLENEAHWTQGDRIYDMRQDFLEVGKMDLPEDCRIVMWPGPRDAIKNPEWAEQYPWITEHYK